LADRCGVVCVLGRRVRKVCVRVRLLPCHLQLSLATRPRILAAARVAGWRGQGLLVRDTRTMHPEESRASHWHRIRDVLPWHRHV
jgi:hypothetical protein